MIVHVPVSVGELVDKLTILEIKAVRLDPAAVANVRVELEALRRVVGESGIAWDAVAPLGERLRAVNERLWDAENRKRALLRSGDTGAEFVAVATAISEGNDLRAALKRAINLGTGSAIVEEKSHVLPAIPAEP